MDDIKKIEPVDEVEGWFGDKLREARDRMRAENKLYGKEEADRRRKERWAKQAADEDAERMRERSLHLMEVSGLKDVIEQCRFDNFTVSQGWQKLMLETCQRFIGQNESRFLYLSGQPGCGKTHLGTAVCAHYINAGKHTLYVIFDAMMDDLKAHVNDDDYSDVLYHYSCPDVLYLDDFMKPVKERDRDGKEVFRPPTAADVKHSFKLINLRMIQRKTTVITSERALEDIIGIDEALGSRIKQMCGEFALNIERKDGRNWRLKG